jgi:hypothetical protein
MANTNDKTMGEVIRDARLAADLASASVTSTSMPA